MAEAIGPGSREVSVRWRRRVHTARTLSLSDDLPVIVIDEPERLRNFVPRVQELVTEGLITLDESESQYVRLPCCAEGVLRLGVASTGGLRTCRPRQALRRWAGSMRYVQTNAELEAIHRDGDGFLFHDLTAAPTVAQQGVVHTAACLWISRMLQHHGLAAQLCVPRIFFETFGEAQSWLAQHRGRETDGWRCCATCRPDRPGRREEVPPLPRRRGQAHGTSGSQRSVSGQAHTVEWAAGGWELFSIRPVSCGAGR